MLLMCVLSMCLYVRDLETGNICRNEKHFRPHIKMWAPLARKTEFDEVRLGLLPEDSHVHTRPRG